MKAKAPSAGIAVVARVAAALVLAGSGHGEVEELDALVVTAEDPETAVELTRPPGNDTVITREEIERAAVGSVAELLQIEAGLPFTSFYGNPGFGSPVLRGFAENSSSRTLILVDGLPVGRPDMGAVPWFQLPLAELERVELRRGSRTVRYGSSALGGVILMETRRAGEEVSGSIESTAGSWHTLRNRFALGTPAGDWGLAVQAEDNRSDGYRENSGYESTGLNFTLDSPLGERLRARWQFSVNDLWFENPGALSKDDYLTDPRQSIYVRYGIDDEFFNEESSLRAAQLLEWDMGCGWLATLNAAWTLRQREINFGPGSYTDTDLGTWNLEPVVSGEIGALALELGLRGQRDDMLLTRYADLERDNPFADADLRRDLVGAFAIGRYDLPGGWSAVAGAGWERYQLDVTARDVRFPNDPLLNFSDSRNDDGFAFEAALEYESADDWRAWTRYDRVYRFPVMDEIAAYQGYVLSDPFNIDLEPERGHNVEAGFAATPGPFEFGLTAFSLWLDGEIGYDYLENRNVNFADTHRFGVETSVAWEDPHWRLKLFHSSTLARFLDGPHEGNRVPLVPQHVFTGSVTWRPCDEFSAVLEGSYVGASYEGNDFDNTAEPLPSRTVFNTVLRWSPCEPFSLFCRVDNLFDRRYAMLKYQGQWYPGSGRQVLVGARWKW